MDTHMPRLRSTRSSFGFFSPVPPIGFPPETCHIMLRKSHGFSCSRSSYSRAIGRIACSATACTIICMLLTASDSSKSIIVVSSHDGEAVEGREPARVPEPELHRMLADVAVPAEDLEGVVGDAERGLARVVLDERRLAGCRLAGIELPRRLPREEAHGVDLDRHVGELERDRLLLR